MELPSPGPRLAWEDGCCKIAQAMGLVMKDTSLGIPIDLS